MAKQPTGSGGEPSSPHCGASAVFTPPCSARARQHSQNFDDGNPHTEQRVGKGTYACIVAVEGGSAVTPDYIHSLLCEHGCQYGCRHGELVHVSVEVNAPQVPPT